MSLIPHSCQMYWWATAEFFQTIVYCIEGHVQPNHYHPVEDIIQLTELFTILTAENQTTLLTMLKNLISMANELGNNWVNPNNRYNDPNLQLRIQNYNQLETAFYNINSQFINNNDYVVIVQIVTRILRRYDSHGARYFNAFLYMFGIQ